MTHTRLVKCERCGCVIGSLQGDGDATGLCAEHAAQEANRGGKTGPKGQAIEYVGKRRK